MKKKLLLLVMGLLFSVQAFAMPNPFIYEEDIIQSSKIANTQHYCLYTAAGTVIADKTEAGYYMPLDVQATIKEVKKKIKTFQKKYAAAKTTAQKNKLKKQIAKAQKTLTSVNTCKKFNVSKLACQVFEGKTLNNIKPMVINGAQCTNQKKSVVAKIVIDYGTGKEDDNDLCTGTLVGSNVFLTAAHCFGSLQLSAIGKLIKEVRVTVAGKTYKATNWQVNPLWDGGTFFGDTALIYIGQNLSKKPFKLIKKDFVPNQGDLAALIGYGVAKYKNKSTPINGYYGGFATISYVDQSAFVTSYVSQAKQATICFGDSGGPLVSWIDGAWRILGTATGGDAELCGYYTGTQNAYWSRVNAPENVQFLETFLPGIFE